MHMRTVITILNRQLLTHTPYRNMARKFPKTSCRYGMARKAPYENHFPRKVFESFSLVSVWSGMK